MQISSSGSDFLSRYAASTNIAKTGTSAFAAAMMGAIANAASGTQEAAAAEENTLTLDEYKAAFLLKIQAMTIHPSQASAQQSISIAEGLFAKMQADPELEQQVLAQIEADFGANFVVPPAFTTMRFDENGVYSGTAGGSAYLDSFEEEAADAFWRKEASSSTTTSVSSKDEEKTRREEKREKAKKLEEFLHELAVQRRLDRQAMQDSYREVVKGTADYISGPTPIVKPSIFESLP